MLSTHVYILKVEHTKDTDKSHYIFVKLECSCNSVHIIYFVGLFAVTTEKKSSCQRVNCQGSRYLWCGIGLVDLYLVKSNHDLGNKISPSVKDT